MPLKPILEDVARYIEHQLDEGVVHLDVPVALADEIAGLAPRRPPAQPAMTIPSPSSSRSLTSHIPVAARVAETVTKSPASTMLSAAETVGAPDPITEMDRIAGAVAGCKRCALHASRKKTVPGQGCLRPEILFVGEAPGADEDAAGLAFVGAAGQLLTKMIEAMGYRREEVFIANILKCRPPGNRTPLPPEVEACLPYLKAQIAILKPRIIVSLGAVAARALLNPSVGITRLRGHWQAFQGIPVMPTLHPSYLLRTPSAKKDAWEDLKAVLDRLGRKPPEKGRGAAAQDP